MDALIGITYRCNARCYMCNTWQYPTNPGDEIKPSHLEKLPNNLDFVNITGGEPFIREDIDEFVRVLSRKTKRIVVSTNGYFTERIIALAEKFPKIGVRVSIEGLSLTNDKLRGIKEGFDKGLKTLLLLKDMGHKDIGFGITISDTNYNDLVPLYLLSEQLGFEFATAVTHNSYYFHKQDNRLEHINEISSALEELINRLLRSNRAKNWFRAYFNHGLIGFVNGKSRLLPCEAGTVLIYIDPFGEVHPCNVLEESMGNIKEKNWDEIWNSENAMKIRQNVAHCGKNCWMIGSVSPIMKRKILAPALWVMKNKIKTLLGKRYSYC